MSKDKSTGKKLADMMYGNPEGAAFGIYPKAGKRSEDKQDREAAKNFPVDLARGVVAGAVGMPGDIEYLIRMLPGLNEKTVLPTSEDVLKRIPLGSDSPTGRFASGLGTLIGGSAPVGPAVQGVKAGARGALSAARAGERMAERVVPQIMERGGVGADVLSGLAQGSRSNVIKPKGGNWLGGSVEGALKPLRRQTAGRDDPAEMLGRVREIYTPEEIEKLQGAAKRHVLGTIAELEKDVALNNWVDRNLGNYIKKEMATPEDPVRRLAEEGIVHIPSEQVGVNRYRAPKHREAYGGEQLGKSEAARAWADASDVAINAPTARTIGANESLYQANPWIEKLSPEDRVYALNKPVSTQQEISGLGFDHILDVLSEDLASGRIRPEQLNKVSMEQAVRRTYEYDQEMAKKMREAQIKATEGMPTYKEYPEGYRWIELAPSKEPKVYTADNLPKGFKLTKDRDGYYQVENRRTGEAPITDSFSRDPEEAIAKFNQFLQAKKRDFDLEDALKYEGDTMGHCVGGYCPDVLEGRSRIYSLRDAKGEPHVTVEVEPNQHLDYNKWYGEQPTSYKALLNAKRSDPGYDPYQEPAYLAARNAMPPKIIQIKGKQNRAPKEDYLPYVQDFVKSGQWSEVGDLGNTGLYKADPSELGMFIPSDPRLKNLPGRRTEDFEKAKQAGLFGDQKYFTRSEWEDILRKQIESESGPLPPLPEDGMARGGPVHFSDNPDVMALELAAGGAVHMQAGGLAKAAKALKAAKVEKELALPPVLPRAPAKTKEEIRPYAQRMAQQMTGEFYRPNPKKSENVAGKSFSQFKMEKDLEHDIRPTREVVEPEVADIEKQLGMLKIGISGDTTIADKILHRAGPYELFDPSPQHGGPRYGLGGEGAWASNNPIAATVQKRVNELSEAYGAPPLGQYMAMGPQGSNFAQHFADANLQAIDTRAMTRSQIEQINRLIREGSEKSGPRPSFPGIEDKGSAYLHFAIDPELRKHFNDLMQKTSVTERLNLPDGRIILHAITEPELRDKEILNTGFSQMRLRSAFDPESLQISAHPTYSHVIPHEEGSILTRTKYPVPGELEFSDVLDYAQQHYRPRDMTRVFQTSTPRQIVDPQHIDEMKMYEELMKEYTGKKKGGAVNKAEGGEITADDLILEERKL